MTGHRYNTSHTRAGCGSLKIGKYNGLRGGLWGITVLRATITTVRV